MFIQIISKEYIRTEANKTLPKLSLWNLLGSFRLVKTLIILFGEKLNIFASEKFRLQVAAKNHTATNFVLPAVKPIHK